MGINAGSLIKTGWDYYKGASSTTSAANDDSVSPFYQQTTTGLNYSHGVFKVVKDFRSMGSEVDDKFFDPKHLKSNLTRPGTIEIAKRLTDTRIEAGSPDSSLPVTPISWELPKWLSVIQEIQDKVQEADRNINKFFDMAQQAIQMWLDNWFGKLTGAYDIANRILMKARVAVNTVLKGLNAILEIISQLAAPWALQKIGQQMQTELSGQTMNFASQATVDKTASNASWKSPGAEAWKAKATEQSEATDTLSQGVTAFGDAAFQMGNEAVKIAQDFFWAVVDCIWEIVGISRKAGGIKNILKLAGPIGQLISLGLALVNLVFNLVKAINGIVAQADAFTSAVQSIGTSEWPKSVADGAGVESVGRCYAPSTGAGSGDYTYPGGNGSATYVTPGGGAGNGDFVAPGGLDGTYTSPTQPPLYA